MSKKITDRSRVPSRVVGGILLVAGILGGGIAIASHKVSPSDKHGDDAAVQEDAPVPKLPPDADRRLASPEERRALQNTLGAEAVYVLNAPYGEESKSLVIGDKISLCLDMKKVVANAKVVRTFCSSRGYCNVAVNLTSVQATRLMTEDLRLANFSIATRQNSTCE